MGGKKPQERDNRRKTRLKNGRKVETEEKKKANTSQISLNVCEGPLTSSLVTNRQTVFTPRAAGQLPEPPRAPRRRLGNSNRNIMNPGTSVTPHLMKYVQTASTPGLPRHEPWRRHRPRHWGAVTRHGNHCFDQSKHVQASSARHSADKGVKCEVKWAYSANGACPEERQGAHLWSIDHVKTAAQHAQPQWSRVL